MSEVLKFEPDADWKQPEAVSHVPMRPSGHADVLLRQTRAHHVQLSAMADVKASMLITMSSIILSLTVSHVLQPGAQWPLLVLVGFCLLTILLAAYAAMPKVHFRKTAPNPAERGSTQFNILFFGDYSGMTYSQFEEEMAPIVNNPEAAYEAQVKEIYALGMYLAKRKYRYLRLAYMAFMGGLAGSVIVIWLGLS